MISNEPTSSEDQYIQGDSKKTGISVFKTQDFNSTQTNRQKTQKIHILRTIETFLPQQDL